MNSYGKKSISLFTVSYVDKTECHRKASKGGQFTMYFYFILEIDCLPQEKYCYSICMKMEGRKTLRAEGKERKLQVLKRLKVFHVG